MTAISSETFPTPSHGQRWLPTLRWAGASSCMARWGLAASIMGLALGATAEARAVLANPVLANPVLATSAQASPANVAEAKIVVEVATSAAQSDESPVIAEALAAVSEEVRVYNDHLTILASPWMEGRLPGTQGMERAKQYMEFHFQEYGLRAPFPQEVENADGTIAVQANASYRQPFRLGATTKVTRAALDMVGGEGPNGGTTTFAHGVANDYTVMGYTVKGGVGGGTLKAPAVFVGYSIARGKDGFTSFPDDLDLKGKIAVMLRFEPMGANGWSKWREDGSSWSGAAGMGGKIRAAADRGAVGIVIVNPPGTPDRRAKKLRRPGGMAPGLEDIPVLHMTLEAGRHLIATATAETTLDELRQLADEGRHAFELPGEVTIEAIVTKEQTSAENIVAVLPGKGRLADQYITIGAHLDHLGMGLFGSMDYSGAGNKLHPGADDNASGCAGILLIAQKMAADYAESEGDMRSIVFIGFSAEESGLHGSQWYIQNPVAPIASHMLMMNFDMIGRITEKKLALSGLETGIGLAQLVEPIVEQSALTIITTGAAMGSSDHVKFEAAGMPVLFAIIANVHGDYHTPRDVSSLINRVDAVHAANLYYDIALAAAARSEPIAYQAFSDRPADKDAKRGRSVPRVRLGVNLPDRQTLTVTAVSAGSTAEQAGVLTGDTILEWNGRPVKNIRRFLGPAKVGDEVTLTVLRGSERVVLKPTKLQAAPKRTGRSLPSRNGNPESAAGAPEGPAGTGAVAGSPRAGSRVMFGIRPVYTDDIGGVLADSITKGSPAETAGLKRGDRVISWNGEELEGARALGGFLQNGKPGDVVEIMIERDGKEISKKVTLRARGGGS